MHDDGEGIDPEFLPHLFERFRQADSSTTRRFGGLGLGLAIVKQLTELHGGTVRAWSEGRGCGAVFTIELPLSPSRMAGQAGKTERSDPAFASRASSRDAPAQPPSNGLVLLVEDQADTREAIARLLERNGYRVTAVANASDALQALCDFRPEVLISDIGMPGEDGYDLIRKIRTLQAEKGRRVPAIALTAYTRVEDRLQALRAGYDMHVPKPVELTELCAVATSLTRRN